MSRFGEGVPGPGDRKLQVLSSSPLTRSLLHPSMGSRPNEWIAAVDAAQKPLETHFTTLLGREWNYTVMWPLHLLASRDRIFLDTFPRSSAFNLSKFMMFSGYETGADHLLFSTDFASQFASAGMFRIGDMDQNLKIADYLQTMQGFGTYYKELESKGGFGGPTDQPIDPDLNRRFNQIIQNINIPGL